ncbi:MAG TPA: hypothetical protein VMW38_22710, partial [Terriglobia bacterium]|nr:hypothetical protein [Terriglobia bacterium]
KEVRRESIETLSWILRYPTTLVAHREITYPHQGSICGLMIDVSGRMPSCAQKSAKSADA